MNKNNIKATDRLSYLENMSEHDFRTKSKEVCKTIIIDQKMIEDKYINDRKRYEEVAKKILEKTKKNDKNSLNKLSFQLLDEYMEMVRQETRREYNRRLLKIIME